MSEKQGGGEEEERKTFGGKTHEYENKKLPKPAAVTVSDSSKTLHPAHNFPCSSQTHRGLVKNIQEAAAACRNKKSEQN